MAVAPNIDHEAVQEMIARGLSPMQARIFHVIVSRVLANGCQPTYQEIMDMFGFTSKGTMAQHIYALRRKGWIEWNARAGTHKGVKILRDFAGNPINGFKFDCPTE